MSLDESKYDEIWRVFDSERGSGQDESHDDDVRLEKESCVVPLGNGQFHVCLGHKCVYAQQSYDSERNITCSLSGRVISQCIEQAHDASWTGRSVGSADPDMVSGSASKSWKFKRDSFALSARAYQRANEIADNDIGFDSYHKCQLIDGSDTTDGRSTKTNKRGALCVSEIDEGVLNEHRKAKAVRRVTHLCRREVQSKLMNEATSVVKKLFSSSHLLPNGENKFDDPRLENYNFVFAVGLKRYVERCALGSSQLNICTMHDIAICASNYVKERRREARKSKMECKTKMLVMNTTTTDLCSRLIVSIWNAVCNTSHFMENQPGDSFRPFASGIMYSMKRGIHLKSGLTVVPCIDVVSCQLPTLRSSAGNSETRHLQASSHKGVCAVHRAIASIDTMPANERQPIVEKLQIAAEISKALANYVVLYMKDSSSRDTKN